MKTSIITLFRAGLMGAFVSGVVLNASATSITGAISFTGDFTVDTPLNLSAAHWIQFSDVAVADASQESGVYAGTAGTSLDLAHAGAFGPISLNPLQSTISPLWTFKIGATTYAFDATSVTVPFSSASALVVEGVGVAHITGYSDTDGTWNVTANQEGGLTFSFSSSSATNAVPDGGATITLLGAGICGIALLSRKWRCAEARAVAPAVLSE